MESITTFALTKIVEESATFVGEQLFHMAFMKEVIPSTESGSR